MVLTGKCVTCCMVRGMWVPVSNQVTVAFSDSTVEVAMWVKALEGHHSIIMVYAYLIKGVVILLQAVPKRNIIERQPEYGEQRLDHLKCQTTYGKILDTPLLSA